MPVNWQMILPICVGAVCALYGFKVQHDYVEKYKIATYERLKKEIEAEETKKVLETASGQPNSSSSNPSPSVSSGKA
jgi:hypothetical protein